MVSSGPPAAPGRQAPSPGRLSSRPRPAQGPCSPSAALCPRRPGLGDPGPRGRPASEGPGLVGRPPWASACFSTGRSGVPMSWRRCPAPWPGWSWGPWSVSRGAPPWTSSRTSGVGVGPFPGGRSGGSPLVSLAASLWSEPVARHLHMPLSVTRSAPPESRCWRRRGPPASAPRGPRQPLGRAVWAPAAGLERGSQGAGLQAGPRPLPPSPGDGTRSSGPFMSEAQAPSFPRQAPADSQVEAREGQVSSWGR